MRGAVPGVTGPIDSLLDELSDFIKGETLRRWIATWGDLALLPVEMIRDLLRNGARLVVIGGVVYFLGPPLLSGYVSAKVASRDRKRKERRR